MEPILTKAGYLLLTLFIIFNYGILLRGFMQKIAARVGKRHGIPFYQIYINLLKNYAKRSHITHGIMYYLGPVFRLTGGIGVLMFVPVLYGSEMFSNLSFAGDLILILYFIFFGALGMALGAGEGGHPYSAIGVTRGLSQLSASEVPLILSIFALAIQYKTFSVTGIVAAQQGGWQNWALFTNPIAVLAGMLAILGGFFYSPFDVLLAPQEIPVGPPTEYHSTYLAILHTNRAIFPAAKLVLYMNLFFGGATGFPALIIKTFLIYFWALFIGVVFPRYRIEQSVRWFLKIPLALGIIAIIVISW